MQYLLDTCAFIWLINGSKKLSADAVRILEQEGVKIFLSTCSVWEIVLKYAKDSQMMRVPPRELIPQMCEHYDICQLRIDEQDLYHTLTIPFYHHDPFDRLLIAQAQRNNLAILTPDEQLRKYDVGVIW